MSGQLPSPVLASTKKPRSTRRVLLWALFLIAVGPVLYLAGAFAYWQLWGQWREISDRKHLVFYKVSPNTVLAACRQIRANQAKFRGNPGWHPPPPVGSDNPDPGDPLMPPIIRTIHPSGIIITPEGVHIEMGGGFEHFGLAETLAGAPRPMMAVKQLVPGLWYYAEDGRIPPP